MDLSREISVVFPYKLLKSIIFVTALAVSCAPGDYLPAGHEHNKAVARVRIALGTEPMGVASRRCERGLEVLVLAFWSHQARRYRLDNASAGASVVRP